MNRAAWNAPTRLYGQPLLTYGQQRQYRVRNNRPDGGRWGWGDGPDR